MEKSSSLPFVFALLLFPNGGTGVGASMACITPVRVIQEHFITFPIRAEAERGGGGDKARKESKNDKRRRSDL